MVQRGPLWAKDVKARLTRKRPVCGDVGQLQADRELEANMVRAIKGERMHIVPFNLILTAPRRRAHNNVRFNG